MNEELPDGWAEAQLSCLTTKVGSGATPRGGSGVYSARGVPFIRSQNIHFEGFRDDGLAFLNQQQAEALKEVTVRYRDVLLNITGASIGRVCIAPKRMDGARVNQHVSIIRTVNTALLPEFLAFYLRSPGLQSRINTEEYGVTRQALTKSWICKLHVPLAPIAEQKRIVAKIEELLGHVASAREHLDCVPAILKRFRQAVLAAACSGQLTGDWHRERKLPSWKVTTIKEIILDRPRNGLSIKGVDYETRIRCLTLTATTSGRYDGSNFKYLDVTIPADSHLWLRSGDILLQRGNTKEYVGVAALYDGENNTYIYPDLMIKIHPRESVVLPEFLWTALSSKEAREYFRENAAGSQGSMPKINQAIVENAIIPLPPIEEQREIVYRVKALFKLADAVEERVSAATIRVGKLTQAILAKAYRGELVPLEAKLASSEGRDYEPISAPLVTVEIPPRQQDRAKLLRHKKTTLISFRQ